MRRWVKPRSKGIALIRTGAGGRPHLEYVFDVADTRPVRGAKTPNLWEMTAEKSGAVTAALERQYGPSEETDIGWQLMEQAKRAVGGAYRDYLEDLRYDTRDSLLEELDDLNLESKGAIETSGPARRRSRRPTTKAPEVSEGELSAAARALAQKMQPDMRENQDGQLSLDLFGTPAPEPPAPPPRPVTPPRKPVVVETILSPELEAERQRRIAAEEKEAAARYDLGYGHMGNGLTVWNRLEEEHGDYKIVAHIASDRAVTFYDQDMPEVVKSKIRKIAMTAEMSISATQDAPVFSVPPQVPEQEQSKQDAVPQSVPTIRELYEKYVPIVKELVLADAAYQNACSNSDRENAYLEGNEAVLRAVRTIEDPVFLRLYFDNTTFHNRLHRDVLDSTYATLSQPQQEHGQDKSGNDLDAVPYNFELEPIRNPVAVPQHSTAIAHQRADHTV